jgi:hypothetical protein
MAQVCRPYSEHTSSRDCKVVLMPTLRTGRENEGTLEWFALQQYFLNTKADVLFLLDCCSAASATTSSQTEVGTKETLAACGFESKAPEPGLHSFTSELINVLQNWKNRTPFSVAMLHPFHLQGANLRYLSECNYNTLKIYNKY